MCDDEELLEAINKVLTSVWSDTIRFMIQSRISRSLMLDLRGETTEVYSSINTLLDSEHRRITKYETTESRISNSAQIHASQKLSSRLKTFQKKSHAPQLWTITEAS